MLLHIYLIAYNGANIRKSYRISVFVDYDGISVQTHYGKIDGKQRSNICRGNSINSAISHINEIIKDRRDRADKSGVPYFPAIIAGEWIDVGIFKKEWISL